MGLLQISTMIKPKTIDLSRADGYAVTDADIVRRMLKQDGCYKKGLVFRGFDGRKLEKMLKYGTDNPNSAISYGCTEQELDDCGIDSVNNALVCAGEKAIPALAVYDSLKLNMDSYPYEFGFADPKNKLDALVAVYILRI